ESDRRGDDVAGQHPVDAVLGRAEARLHVRQSDVGDGRIEDLEEHRHHHPDGDDDPQPGGQRVRGDVRRGGQGSYFFAGVSNTTVAVVDRPAIIGLSGVPLNAIRTGTRWVT